MKLMIASDIHGSTFYLCKMLQAYKKEAPNKLLLLGDLLYHGPRNNLPKDYDPKAVIQMLNSINGELLCVRGNCDSEVDQMVLKFPIMAEYGFLYEWNHMIFITHGHKYGEQNPPHLKAGDILLNGHTHVPAYKEYESYIYMNPGSVSIPKEGSSHSYMILEDGSFKWKDLDGNVYMEKQPWK